MTLPGRERVGRLGDDEDAHPRVLDSAVLRARPDVIAWRVGLEPDARRSSRRHVDLAPELRHPEVMDDVVADSSRTTSGLPVGMWISFAAIDARRIPRLPPPRMADDRDVRLSDPREGRRTSIARAVRKRSQARIRMGAIVQAISRRGSALPPAPVPVPSGAEMDDAVGDQAGDEEEDRAADVEERAREEVNGWRSPEARRDRTATRARRP